MPIDEDDPRRPDFQPPVIKRKRYSAGERKSYGRGYGKGTKDTKAKMRDKLRNYQLEQEQNNAVQHQFMYLYRIMLVAILRQWPNAKNSQARRQFAEADYDKTVKEFLAASGYSMAYWRDNYPKVVHRLNRDFPLRIPADIDAVLRRLFFVDDADNETEENNVISFRKRRKSR